jgi:hypothetical protein
MRSASNGRPSRPVDRIDYRLNSSRPLQLVLPTCTWAVCKRKAWDGMRGQTRRPSGVDVCNVLIIALCILGKSFLMLPRYLTSTWNP